MDAIAQWAPPPHDQACAGAQKVRIDLELGDQVPPGLQDAGEIGIERVTVDAFDGELAGNLMDLGDEDGIGPGTPRVTVAVSAVYGALKLLGDTGRVLRFATRQEVVNAVTPVVAMTTSKISRYNCELIDAYEARCGTQDPDAVLG